MAPLSIVVPTYNTAEMTLECCRTVVRTMPAGAEVIVVDDASSDGTTELLAQQLPAVRLVRLATNGGYSAAANAGVAASRSDVIVLLNSDAIVGDDALTMLHAVFEAEQELGVAGAQLLNADASPQWSGGRAPTLTWMLAVVSGAGARLGALRPRRNDAPQREVDWVSGAAMAFRRATWNDAGPLDERFRFYCQDIEFCVRARDAGWNVRIVPESRVTHALGHTVASDTALSFDPERLWPDLLAWGARRYGEAWARRAQPLLRFAAWMRVFARLLKHGFHHDAGTQSMIRAARALRQSVA